MTRAAAFFLLFVALLSAGAVFAETIGEIGRRAAAEAAARQPLSTAPPVALSASLTVDFAAEGHSITVVRALRSKTVIEADDLTVTDGRAPGGIGSIEEAVGMEAKVALYPGRPILLSQIGAPALVERNTLVKLTYMHGPLSIVTEGRALDRAAAGEVVRVMNLQSRQTVAGTVATDGSVEVGQ